MSCTNRRLRKIPDVKRDMLEYCRQRFIGSIVIDNLAGRKPDCIFVIKDVEGIEYGLQYGYEYLTVSFTGIYLSMTHSDKLQRFSDENAYCTKRVNIKRRSYQVSMETGELKSCMEVTMREVSDMFGISFEDKNGDAFYMGDTIKYIDEDRTEKTGLVTGR